ncbi:MAG TPA: hypothetical protein VG899_14245 [Mycobacteriales bacterium]|nr:hypothetical protein [Mycobacteriales bacterium]HWA67518.1 hypothetical protein [Mycobacteriales bacterium]
MSADFDALDALSTSELRERAFSKAEHAHDIGFFWDLVKHLGASEAIGADDGSAGGLGESIRGAIDAVSELLGRRPNEDESMLRARYIDYLLA